MHIFAQKPKAPQQTKSSISITPSRASLEQSRDVRSTLQLQRTIGNQVVQRLLENDGEKRNAGLIDNTASPGFGQDFSQIPGNSSTVGGLQAKLAISKPGDESEQEADRVADQVMRMGDADVAQQVQANQVPSQTSKVSSGVESPINRQKGNGQPLDLATRSFFEPRFGRNFDDVRIHPDAQAASMARRIGARAFTLDRDIVFNEGEYAPGTSQGRRLLAHELVHTIQQNKTSPDAGGANQSVGVAVNASTENVIQRDRDPDIVHNDHYTFYLLGGGGREFALQFHFTGEGSTATVKLASLRQTGMIEETYTLENPAAFAPRVIYEDGVTTLIDVDGDDRAEFEVHITNNSLYSVDYLTSTSTPGDPSYTRQAVRESFAILRWGEQERILRANVEEHAPAWSMRPHPHPNIDFMYYNRVTGETFIPSLVTQVSSDFRGVRSGRIVIANRAITVLDWGESWNGFNVAGGIATAGEIDASSVENMVEQVEDSLAEGSCISSLTIIGHGSPGSISVGDGTGRIEGKHIRGGALDSTSDIYDAEMARLLARLTPLFCSNATATLRGCNVGDGPLGESFVQNLANLWQVPVRAHVGTIRGGGYWTTGDWTEADP